MRDRNPTKDRSPPRAKFVLSCAALLVAFSPPATAELNWRPIWLAVELNGVVQPPTIVIASNGRLWVERSAIDTWRIERRETLAAREFLGRMYYPVDELANSAQLQCQIDERRQALIVTATPAAFRDNVIS